MTNSGVSVAVKVFFDQKRPQARTLHLSVREALTWHQLKHPNIVPFLGIADYAKISPGSLSQLCIVSPWMKAGNIMQFIMSDPSTDRLTLLLDIVHAVEYLHNLPSGPVIHGDIKGANVLIDVTDERPMALLTDFGLSQIMESTRLDITFTSTAVLGSLPWMAVERLQSGSSTGSRSTLSDVFEMMRTFYEILTGRTPFHGSNIFQILAKVHQGEVPERPTQYCPGLDDDRWALMQQAWSPTPAERPSLQTILHDLEESIRLEALVTSQSSIDFEGLLQEGVSPERLLHLVQRRRALTAGINKNAIFFVPPSAPATGENMALVLSRLPSAIPAMPEGVSAGRDDSSILQMANSPAQSESRTHQGYDKHDKVPEDTPCWKLIPIALNMNGIHHEWQDYALLISFENQGDRCLRYNDKPLLLYDQLKAKGENPVFYVHHINDVRSPIVLAKEKAAKRKTEPIVEEDSNDRSKDAVKDEKQGKLVPLDKPMYALVVYPYLAEQSDEIDVSMGECLIIAQQSEGWRVCYRDVNGDGVIDESAECGWVSAGCLVELGNLRSGTTATVEKEGSSPKGHQHRKFTPMTITATQVPAFALKDYQPRGDHELPLKKGDALRVFKRYNHWEYGIKDSTGEHGWYPSWYVAESVAIEGVPDFA